MTVRGAEVEMGDNTETELLFPDFSMVVTSLLRRLEVEAGLLPEVGEGAVDDMASARRSEPPGASEALAVVSYTVVRTVAFVTFVVTVVAVVVVVAMIVVAAVVVVKLLATVFLVFVVVSSVLSQSKCLK